MTRFDCHVHMDVKYSSAAELISKLDAASVTGANIISVPPNGYVFSKEPADYEERVASLLSFVSEYPDRLIPSLFIHPDEESVLDKIDDAVSRGVRGFKMMCSDYYVYEDKSMRVLEKIAKVKRPVLFHSGILYDGKVSSAYNRPINWECLIEIPGLRFALAHCSWPWIDECIALYGKMRDCRMRLGDGACEMFVDITPGTPRIYRKELFTKLHSLGWFDYNILFGTDNEADKYSVEYADYLQKMDDGFYDELEVSAKVRKKIYEDNFKRFFNLQV